ncbi:MAG: hypothetical protein BM563_09930 [Bacteroidetes bacterium MedPE-SWsnd-G1]|nr:MAG: hypothetical protein BM563_09930 [Bacteroidetes bacterium MedPE-SWsnd-G1]
MIKFFRKIRQDLLSKGKTGKYFKYAIGEVVLVVIGILIALQINNWNENKKQEQRAIIYANKIINDIKTDLKNIDSLVVVGQRNVKEIENYFNYFENQDPVDIRMLIDSCSNVIKDVMRKYRYTPNNHTFKDMQASGNSTLLSEDQKKALVALSNTQDFYLIVFEKIISSIIEYERQMKAYIDSDLSKSNFFERINITQNENDLVQGLLFQHNSLTSYSELYEYTLRLKKRISDESNFALITLKN